MKKIVAFIVAVVAISNVFAQDDKNLVTNPSFEASAKGKLKKLKQINVAENWDSPTGLKADLFSTAKASPCSAPDNQFGKEHPMDGNRYAGIMLYSYNNKAPRTYIQTELLGALKKDVEYCVKFHVSLSDLSKYSVNNLGVYLGKTPLGMEAKTDIIFDDEKSISQIVLQPGNKVFNARYNWEPVCNVFKAKGKERYITIGNFYNNKDTKYEKMKKMPNFRGTQVPMAYYYIDQVEVFVLEDPSECNCSNQVNKEKAESIIYHNEFNSEEGYTPEEIVNLTSVYFDILSYKIEQMMYKDLDNLIAIMEANPDYKIELRGSTDQIELDAIPKDPENEKIRNLATKRAKKIKEYIVSKGIASERVSVVEQQITQSNSKGMTSLDQAKNRKVKVKLVQ